MKRYYITDLNAERGFVEVSEDEFHALLGTDETRLYVSKVYRGTMSIDDVPIELREEVRAVVNNKIARFGEYTKQDIPAAELKSMIEGVV